MRTVFALVAGLLAGAALVAQTTPSVIVVGDHSSPLRPLASAGNVGVSNAVMRDQPEVQVLRVVIEPGGTRVLHQHDNVKFHLFVPISSAMQVNLDGDQHVNVPAWQPYFMKVGTRHGFHNGGTAAVEVMEIFVR